MFIAQHKMREELGDGRIVGRFHTFEEARHALDERLPETAWQGIRDEMTGARWWRGDTTTPWRWCTPTSDP